jgi:protoporphyrinogen oxidase
MSDPKSTIVIGAGPAGLTAAYQLAKQGIAVTVLEADTEYVGGISKTVEYNGFRFDIGGHRFFSKCQEVEDFWTEILEDELLVRPRSSRIYYRGQFFGYPLKPVEALLKLGVVEAARCMFSYLRARVAPIPNPRSFEQWVSNQFGSRLYRIFFKTYTEKVWGMPCSEISADWAAQRIKGLSLWSAIWSALKPQRKSKQRGEVIKTLIDAFRYPRLGPGQMWEVCADKIVEMGGTVLLDRRVVEAQFDEQTASWAVTWEDARGLRETLRAQHLVSSAPILDLVPMLGPEVSEETEQAAKSLRYRDFLTVSLILEERNQFSDNWIYIHDPNVKVGRIQNFKSWSPEMVPDPSRCCYGLEYFCAEGDDTWTAPDDELMELATRELEYLGLARPGDVVDGCVVRQRKAYPVYDDFYAEHVERVRSELAEAFPTLHLVGRNGMHKYNNQDHSMMTAMLAAQNIVAGANLYDLWRVNEDAEYHEAGESGELSLERGKPSGESDPGASTSGLRSVPSRVSSSSD